MAIIRSKDRFEQVSWLYRMGRCTCAFVGAAYATVGAWPMAALAKILFGFELPAVDFSPEVQSLVDMARALFGYSLYGGFPVLAIFGAIAGWLVRARYDDQPPRRLNLEILLYALVIDFAIACVEGLVVIAVFGTRAV